MSKFTVILLRPDYMADCSTPADTYTAHVKAEDRHGAVNQAQWEAGQADKIYDCCGDHADYHPIAVFKGHLEAL